MKKFTLILIAFIFSISFVNAQSYTLTWEGETYGDTVVVNGTPDEELVFHGILTNNSLETDTVKIQRRFIYLMDSVSHYFCWGQCYMPIFDSIFRPNGFIELEPGQSSAELDFAGHYTPFTSYTPGGFIGTSIVEYTFYSKSNEDENLTIVAKFVTTPDAIDENILSNISVSNIYPNPAMNFVNMDYDLPAEVKTASVKIVNLLGSVMMEQQVDVDNSNMRMNISNLDGGIYFYSLLVNGEIYSTKKLIVR
jgi:hypothetical protein